MLEEEGVDLVEEVLIEVVGEEEIEILILKCIIIYIINL